MLLLSGGRRSFLSPQIPTNTGSMGRTCIGLGARLHLVKPLGFELTNTKVKRSGLDYWPEVELSVHDSWADCAAAADKAAAADMLAVDGADADADANADADATPWWWFFTRAGDCGLAEAEQSWRSAAAAAAAAASPLVSGGGGRRRRPLYLVFGSEIDGFPAELEEQIDAGLGHQVAIPMQRQDVIRCYNLSASATMALWAAYSAYSETSSAARLP